MVKKKKTDEHKVAVQGRRDKILREKIERCTEAIILAEASLPEEAKELIRGETS